MFDKGQGYPAAYRADATVVMNAANPQIEGRISTRVQTVATAAEELSTSISEISRQVAQSAKITDRAVENARRTDTIVRACRRCAADRARRGADFEYRGTDQSARAQCDHRSRSRR
jgi:hypothetical protein